LVLVIVAEVTSLEVCREGIHERTFTHDETLNLVGHPMRADRAGNLGSSRRRAHSAGCLVTQHGTGHTRLRWRRLDR
jgi:hypothetical protein